MSETTSAELSLEERTQIVDERRQMEYYRARSELEHEKRELCARAPVVLYLLRRHLPAEVLREVEEYLSSGWGCEFIREELTPPPAQSAKHDARVGQSEDPFDFESPALAMFK